MNAITDPRHAAADDEDDVLFARKERVGKYMPAEERAARLVRKLDAFLRKGPRKGLNYQKWQQLAYKEAVDELLRGSITTA